jgi:hypothetical protein
LRDPREIYDFAQRLGLVSPVHEHRLLALFHQNAGDLRPDEAGTDDQYGHEYTIYRSKRGSHVAIGGKMKIKASAMVESII